MKFERVSHKLWYINRSRLEVFKIDIALQLHHMFAICVQSGYLDFISGS